MKPIQVVMDERLLARLDAVARRRRLSRSRVIRESVARGLDAEALDALVAADRRGYRETPPTAEEKAAFRHLRRAQDRVLADLASLDRKGSW